jgi:hypothetical protein
VSPEVQEGIWALLLGLSSFLFAKWRKEAARRPDWRNSSREAVAEAVESIRQKRIEDKRAIWAKLNELGDQLAVLERADRENTSEHSRLRNRISELERGQA